MEAAGHVLRAVVVPDGEPRRDVLGEGAEGATHALAQRLERLEAGGTEGRAAWTPTHSAGQWSRATDTAAWPPPVMVVVGSVPQITSTASGMMVPSWLRGPRAGPARVGAGRSCSRVGRSTRRLEVRSPAWRSLAQTFLCPSP